MLHPVYLLRPFQFSSKLIFIKWGIYNVNPNRFNIPDSSWHSMKFSMETIFFMFPNSLLVIGYFRTISRNILVSSPIQRCNSQLGQHSIMLISIIRLHQMDCRFVIGFVAARQVVLSRILKEMRFIGLFRSFLVSMLKKNHNNVISRDKIIVFCF